MDRRGFMRFAAALAAAHGFAPAALRARSASRFADMHTHLGFPRGPASFRAAMAEGGMLLVAEKVTPDMPLIRLVGNRLQVTREPRPGELRGNFEAGLALRKRRLRAEGLPEIVSTAALERALAGRSPGVVIAAEGADFLEGDLAYLERVRAEGLVHLQLVHYYAGSGLGDISTEAPKHGGLTEFGRDVVRACNRLGILVDVAHCTNAGIEQAVELSSRPVIYSHGHVSQAAASPSQGGIAARAIHAPAAKRLAERGGVIGLWPLQQQFANLDLYCDRLAQMADTLGVRHIGIGTDMFGVTRSVVPSYAQFAELPAQLERRGMKPGEVDAVLGANYIRVLREALGA